MVFLTELKSQVESQIDIENARKRRMANLNEQQSLINMISNYQKAKKIIDDLLKSINK